MTHARKRLAELLKCGRKKIRGGLGSQPVSIDYCLDSHLEDGKRRREGGAFILIDAGFVEHVER